MYSALILFLGDKNQIEIFENKLDLEIPVSIERACNKEEALNKVDLLEPDLILMPTEVDSVSGDMICKELRKVPCLTRPVIVVFSNNPQEDSSKKIEYFVAGADDFLDTSIPDNEFSIRIAAHLRRHIEDLSNSNSNLPATKLINTNLKRRINLNLKWSLIQISINNLKTYNDTYGDLAGNQLLKAFIAIIKSNLTDKDFIGHLGNENFSIITNTAKAEPIAIYVCQTFDKIVPKFYAPFEAKRGYTIITDDERASLKVPLVYTSLGIVSNSYRKIDNYQTAINIANTMKELARHQLGSGWLLDRPLLASNEQISNLNEKHSVVVVETDAALAYLLTTTLEMEGYIVEATVNSEEAIYIINNMKPDLVIIDAMVYGDEGWKICKYIRQQKELLKTKIIMTTVIHDREKAFLEGADLYIPKPYELLALHKWINRLIKESYYNY